MITNTQPTLFDAKTGNRAKQLLGDVPFTDVDGNPIYIGNIIEQTNFNGEPYTARYEVVIDPADKEVCLLMLSGNDKAMSSKGYSAFGTVVNGKLRKGRIVRRIA